MAEVNVVATGNGATDHTNLEAGAVSAQASSPLDRLA